MTAPVLIGTVAAVGVLHTLVPDHWAPIVVIARQRGWSVLRTARAAAIAGVGHVTSTLVLGALLWAAGAALAVRYGHAVSVAAALALIAFGAWIAYGGWRELHDEHRHAAGGGAASGTALLLILGSSPMVEGIPAFFAASSYGAALLGVMAVVFAAATILTYAAVSSLAVAGVRRVSLGPLERYGEVLSGAFVALVGVYALVTA